MAREKANSEYDEIVDVGMDRPHVVIVGAGASLASFPDGDRNGIKLPLMNNLVEFCQLESTLSKFGADSDTENFEELFSELFLEGNTELLSEIENQLFSYFESMQLNESPTIYDYLVISLRPKDLIATFNWDPFLWQALTRNRKWIETPNAAFLHGNVAIGYCPNDKQMGVRRGKCSHCNKPYTPVPLLYPIKEKNYQENTFVAAEWAKLRNYLQSAYVVTVFGYGAPVTDTEAMDLMSDAYKSTGSRELEEIEIIDIKDEDELRETWSPFIVSHHYRVCKDFFSSWIANHPRRSCETMWEQLMEVKFLDPHQVPLTDDWARLRQWFQPLIDAEINEQI